MEPAQGQQSRNFETKVCCKARDDVPPLLQLGDAVTSVWSQGIHPSGGMYDEVRTTVEAAVEVDIDFDVEAAGAGPRFPSLILRLPSTVFAARQEPDFRDVLRHPSFAGRKVWDLLFPRRTRYSAPALFPRSVLVAVPLDGL
eukprot:g419.t1